MIQIEYTLRLEHGIHGRPATRLVELAKGRESRVQITCGEKTADARKIFALMTLGADRGDTVSVTVEGPDEEETAHMLQDLLQEQF